MDLTLRAARYQFNFIVTEELRIPAFSGSMLRGVLGWALMRLGDLTTADIKNRTPRYCYSVYAAVFDPLQGYAAQEIDLHTPNLPVPYVIEVPLNQEKTYKRGEVFSFRMVVMNEGLKYLPTIIAAWQQAFLRGISSKQQGKALLQEVLHLSNTGKKAIYSASKPFVETHCTLLKAPNFTHDQEVKITLDTPLRIQFRGNILNEDSLTGSIYLRNMVRRFCICLQLDGQKLMQERLAELNYLAEQVKSEGELYGVTVSRYSNRQRSKMYLEGVMGELILKNVPRELLPIIWFCQYLHVGKNTSFGFGGFKALASL